MTTSTAGPPAQAGPPDRPPLPAPDPITAMTAAANPGADPDTVAALAARHTARGRSVCAAAAALIRRRGHRQGRLGDPKTGYCINGAVIMGCADPGLEHALTWPQAFQAAAADPGAAVAVTLLRDHLDINQLWALAEWNDNPGRTAAEALEALDRVAAADAGPRP